MFTYKWYFDFVNHCIKKQRKLLLRHDIDISLKKAVELAEMENQAGIATSYYILFSSPFYNALDQENIERIRMIAELGHMVGLHYDLSLIDREDNNIRNIVSQRAVLESILNTEVNGITFHSPAFGKKPDYELLTSLQQIGLFDPNFSKEYKYISDSGQNWREDPYDAVERYNALHINTHPIWYNEREKSFGECLIDLRLDVKKDKEVIKEINHIKEYRERLNSGNDDKMTV